jgi:DeoR family fructose operon transcriptional repressor
LVNGRWSLDLRNEKVTTPANFLQKWFQDQNMKGSGRVTSQRRQKLLSQLERQDSVRISDLATTFQVSEITVRRDLDDLAEKGLLERFHGGARWLARPKPDETSFEEKPYLHAAEKDAIGAAAAALVKSEDTVLLNGGTTTLAVLRHIKQTNVRIVTNNTAATNEVSGTDIELILLGGEYRAKSRSLFGDLATLTLSQIHASVCILGANGVSARTGLTTSVYPEAAINRLMAERCNGNVIAVTDGSKIGVTSNFASVPLIGVKILITDESANPDELAAIKAAGVQTIIVGSINGGTKGVSQI